MCVTEKVLKCLIFAIFLSLYSFLRNIVNQTIFQYTCHQRAFLLRITKWQMKETEGAKVTYLSVNKNVSVLNEFLTSIVNT